MKITKITTVIILIVTSCVLAMPDCPEVYKNGDAKTVDIRGTDQIYPKDQETKATKDNALKQTSAARELFYKPGPDALNLIKTAAKNLIALYNTSKETIAAFKTFVGSKEQRQTSTVGTAQELLKTAYNLRIETGNFAELAIQKLMDNMANPSPTDILAFLGLVGDFGAAIQDTYGRKKAKDDQSKIAAIFNANISNLEVKAAEIYKNYSPDSYYDSPEKKQSKSAERMLCGRIKGAVVYKDVKRSGVLNTGEDADRGLKAKRTLPPIGWPWQTIPKKLTTFCATEPWAGHFSGSFYELVFMLELFSQNPAPSGKKFDASKSADPKVKSAAIAWASAFLIATGMHSSVEIAFVAMKMDGKAKGNIDLSDAKLSELICGNGVSTTYISGIHAAATSKRKLKK